MNAKTYTWTKNEGKLHFAMLAGEDVRYFEHDFGDYKLEARIVSNRNGDEPWVLSIHGARADYTKSDPISLLLQEQGFSILGINMSGHNDASPIALEQTTLQNNIDEAEAFFEYLDPSKKKIVMAYSLGGTPALKLLAKHADEISHLVLFYPGVYDAKAYPAHYGSEFRDVISKPYSYRHNDTMELLKAFQGKLLLVRGEYDGLDPVDYGKPAGTSVGEVVIDGQKHYSPIPKEVIDMILGAVPNERRTEIVIPHCSHAIMPYAREHPKLLKRLISDITAFLQT